MPFSPDTFKAKGPGDFALPSTFIMRIPTQILGITSDDVPDFNDLENLSFLCNQTVLPGRHFSTNEYTTHGPVRRAPYQSIYDQLQVSVFCRSDLLERKFFGYWQNKIQNDTNYQWRYFNDYVSDLELWYFARTIQNKDLRDKRSLGGGNGPPTAGSWEDIKNAWFGTEYQPPPRADATINETEAMSMISHKVRFIDAYPLAIQPLALDWGAKDQFLNLNITFSYTKWKEIPVRYGIHGNDSNLDRLGNDGPTLREMLSWGRDTIELIDQYTGIVPDWMKRASHGFPSRGTIDAQINKVTSRFPPT